MLAHAIIFKKVSCLLVCDSVMPVHWIPENLPPNHNDAVNVTTLSSPGRRLRLKPGLSHSHGIEHTLRSLYYVCSTSISLFVKGYLLTFYHGGEQHIAKRCYKNLSYTYLGKFRNMTQ